MKWDFTKMKKTANFTIHVYTFRDRVDEKKLARNIHILAEALARHVYNLTSQGNVQLFNEALVNIPTLLLT